MVLGAFLTGLSLAAFMGMGAAFTIGLFGLIGIAMRRGFLGIVDPQGEVLNYILAVLEVGSAVVILLLGLVFFASSL